VGPGRQGREHEVPGAGGSSVVRHDGVWVVDVAGWISVIGQAARSEIDRIKRSCW